MSAPSSSTTVTVFSFVLNAIKSIIFTTINIIKSTRFNTQFFLLGLGVASSAIVLIFICVVVRSIIKETTGYGQSHLDRIKKKKKPGKSALAKADVVSLGLAIGMTLLTTAGVSYSVLTTFIQLIWSALPILIGFLAVTGVGYVYLTYSDSIYSTINKAYVQIWVPLMTFVTMAGASVILIVETVYPIYTAVIRFINGIPYQIIIVAVICIGELLPAIVQGVFNIVYSFIVNLVAWITMNPLYTEIPMLNTLEFITTLIATVGTTVIECICHVLRYIIGGFLRAFQDPSLAYAILNAINLVWVFAMQVIVIPTLSLFSLIVGNAFIWPSFTRSFDLYIGTLDNTGFFVQNATVITLDIWVCGGNGTIIGMVNGSIPMPTDNLQYLIRALQAQWARGILRGISLFSPIMVFWQLASFFQGIPFIAQSDGNVLTWNILWTYNEAIFVASAFGSFLALAGQCSTGNTYPITPVAQLSTIFTAAAQVLRCIWDIFWGEIYYFSFNLTFPGIFTDSFLQTSPVYADYQQNVVYAGIAFGCLLGYLSAYFGVSFQGVLETLLIYLLLIPAQILTRVRAIFGGTSANVLDDIDIDQMEAALLKIGQVGGFFWEFEPGATQVTCQTRLTLFCNLGLAIILAFGVLARLITTIVQIIVNFIKFITGAIQQNTYITIEIPRDVACNAALSASSSQITGSNCKMILVEDIYSAGCRIGVVLGNILPVDLPCMSGANGFCNVAEFPNIGPNTFTKCTSTFLCKVGRYLGIIPDFFFTIFNWVVGFNWQNPGQSVGADNQFLVNIFKKVMYLVVWGLLGPSCPFGHVLDCLWSLLLRAGGGDGKATPASSLICLITAFLVVLVRDVGDLIITLIRIIVFLLSLIFGIPAVGNSAAEFGQLVSDFFTVFGQTLQKIIMLFLTLALQGLFAALGAICQLISDAADFFRGLGFDTAVIDCSVLSDSLSSILSALGVTPIDAPENRNYKRSVDVNVAEETVQATINANAANSQPPVRKCTPIFVSPEYEEAFYQNINRGYPANIRESCVEDEPIETWPPTQPPATLEEMYAPTSKGKSADGSFGEEQAVYEAKSANGRYSGRTRVSESISGQPRIGMLQEIVLRHFGRGTPNPDEIPYYMNKYVYWAPASSCRFVFEQAKDKLISQLGPSDRLAIADCIRLKLLAVTMSAASPLTSWIPEDMFYNFFSAMGGLAIKIGRFALVAIHFFYDRNVDPRILLSKSYQDKWRTLQFKIDFYNDTLLPVFLSAGSNETEGYRLVGERVQNFTLMSYLVRSFPSLYIKTPEDSKNAFRDGDALLDPLQGFLDYTYEVAKEAATGAGINAEKILAFRNQTYGFFFNYTASAGSENLPYYKRPAFVLYQGQYWDYNNRTHLLAGLGPDVVRIMDSYRSTKSLYNIFSRSVELISHVIEKVTSNATGNLTPTSNTTNPNSWFDYLPPVGVKRDDLPLEMQLHVEGFVSAGASFVSEAVRTPAAIFSNGSTLLESWKQSIFERLESLYSSPAFEKELTPAGALIAGIMSALHKFSGANESKIMPPWCVAKIATAHKMNFTEVRQNFTAADCPYYANIGFRNDIIYNEATKEMYERTPSGDLILKRGTRLPPEKSFMEKYIPALNSQAVYNREAFSKIFQSVGNEIWGYSYIFLGDKGSALDRFVEVALDMHPSFANYRADHDIYTQVMKMLPEKRAAELKARNHIKFDDHDVFEAWKLAPGAHWIFNMTAKFREAALVHQAIHDEMIILQSKPICRESMEAWRVTRNRMRGTKDGELFQQINNLVKTAKINAYMARMGRVQTNKQNDMTVYDQFSELDMNVELADAVSALDFGINITNPFVKECHSSQQWLCDECYILDALLGRLIQIINYATTYYTTQFPAMVEEQLTIIQYYTRLGNTSFPGVPPAYIGNNRTSQPRFPNLGEPVGVMLQWSQDEIANGLDWFKWLWPIIGANMTGLVTNGTCYNTILNYNVANEVETSPSSDVFIGVLRILQFDFGWNICGVIDTVQFIFLECTPAIGNWIVNHIFLCNFTTAVDCSARVYSFSGGIIVIGVELIIILAGLAVLLYSASGIYMTIVVALIAAIIPTFLILVYDWCFFCAPIVPMCIFQDILNFWVFTPILSGPCSIVIGSHVNDSSYSNILCAASNGSTPFANGAAQGFTNPINTLHFAQLAYNTTWGIADWVIPAWEFLFGDATPTFTYADYFTNPVRHSNYTVFFIASALTYGFFSLFIVYVAYALVFSILSSAFPLLTALLVGFFAFLKFMKSIQ